MSTWVNRRLKDTQRNWRTMDFWESWIWKKTTAGLSSPGFFCGAKEVTKSEPRSLHFIFCPLGPLIWTLPEANPGLFSCIAQGQDSFFPCSCRSSQMLTSNISSTAAWNKRERSRWKSQEQQQQYLLSRYGAGVQLRLPWSFISTS